MKVSRRAVIKVEIGAAAGAVGTVALIAATCADLAVRVAHRQHAGFVEAVWPVTAPYFGPLTLWACHLWGLSLGPQWEDERGEVYPDSWCSEVRS